MSWSVLFGPAINLLSRTWDWARKKSRKREDDEWDNKFMDAISALGNALPRTLVEGPAGFVTLVPDKEMRDRIEVHLIRPKPNYSTTKLEARTLGPEQLRGPIVRRTIQDVLDCVDTLRREKPEIAARLHV